MNMKPKESSQERNPANALASPAERALQMPDQQAPQSIPPSGLIQLPCGVVVVGEAVVEGRGIPGGVGAFISPPAPRASLFSDERPEEVVIGVLCDAVASAGGAWRDMEACSLTGASSHRPRRRSAPKQRCMRQFNL